LPGCGSPSGQLAAAAGAIPGEVVDDLVLTVSQAVTNAILCGYLQHRLVKVAVGMQGGSIEATICDRAAPRPTPLSARVRLRALT
jgi:hypothetical protein